MRGLLHETVAGWPIRDLYVGCSGNLTVERTLHDLGLRLHGNDVLLYTSAQGCYFAGTPLEPLDLSDLGKAELPWAKKTMGSDLDRLATVLMCSNIQLVSTIGKTNAYYDRIKRAFRDQWKELHAKTRENLEATSFRLASFDPEDVATWIGRVPRRKTVGFVAYPPFVGAHEAFERDFAKLESLFSWEKPTFEMLEPERLSKLYERIADRPHWMLGINRRVDSLDPFLRARAQTTNRGVPVYVYASEGPTRVIAPQQATSASGFQHLMAGEEIGDTIRLMELTLGQFSSLRSMYMNRHIRPGQPSNAFAVVVDDRLVGVLAYSAAPTVARWDRHLPTPAVYLLSDFPVSGTDYGRLSKLIVMASCSEEARLAMERYANKRYRSMVTTAFSANPASMKYRGVLRLLKRDENHALSEEWAREIDPTDPYYGQRYQLQYGSEFGRWTLAEALADWKAKHL